MKKKWHQILTFLSFTVIFGFLLQRSVLESEVDKQNENEESSHERLQRVVLAEESDSEEHRRLSPFQSLNIKFPISLHQKLGTSSYLKDVHNRRAADVDRTCEKYNLTGDVTAVSNYYQEMKVSAFRKPRDTLMHLQQWNLLYCWIHKAASTSWNKVFFKLAGEKIAEGNLHEAAAFFRPNENIDLSVLFQKSLTFTFVRHPFERIVSAFRDKFESGNKGNYMYVTYAADILGISVPKSQLRHTLNQKDRPTFTQFVDYLLRTEIKDYNDHWYPFWLQCHLCDQSFDVLGKFESIQEDTELIQQISGLKEKNISFPWANKKDTKSEVGLKYFKQLDLERTKQLYKIYKVDFEMFQYDTEEYFQLF